MKSFLAAVAALGFLAAGCEMLETGPGTPVGGDLLGTWGLLESAIKAANAPEWTAIRYGEQRAAARGMFGRIAFYADNTCYGEMINEGRTQNFEGTWTASGVDLIIDAGGNLVAGEYSVANDLLDFTTTERDGEIDIAVTFTMKRAPALEQPAHMRPDEAGAADDAGDGGSQGGGSSRAGGSNTFLWKPESENDGNAVTLFPARYRLDDIEKAYISGGDRDGDKARTIYWPDGHNGNRVHARWSAPGEDFGEDFEVVLVLESGDEVSWKVDDGADRQED